MATEGKRIYEFTDEQAAYSPDIYLATDDSTFASGAKKVKMGSIYPLTFTLAAAGSINTATQLLRTDNGSGDESKITADDFADAIEANIDAFIGIKLRLSATISETGSATKVNGDLSVSATRPNTGRYLITHGLGSTNYLVVASVITNDTIESPIKIASIYQGSTDMVIHTGDNETLTNTALRFSLFEFKI